LNRDDRDVDHDIVRGHPWIVGEREKETVRFKVTGRGLEEIQFQDPRGGPQYIDLYPQPLTIAG